MNPIIKSTAITHTIDYCVNLIVNNVVNQLSVPHGAKLQVSIEKSQLVLISIIPNNEDVGYSIYSTVAEISKFMFNKNVITEPHYRIQYREVDDVLLIHSRMSDKCLIERNIEYKHTPDNFIDTIFEYAVDIYEAYVRTL